MSANKVVEKILLEAQSQVEQIQKESQEEIGRMRGKFEASLGAYNQETKRLADAAAKEAASQVQAAARMQIAKEMLSVKGRLIEETFVQAGEKIKNMPQQEYKDMLEKLLVSASKSGDEEILLDKNENRLDSGFIDYINGKYNLALKLSSQRADIGSGFILQKGKVRINCALEVMLSEAKESLQTQMANELFG